VASQTLRTPSDLASRLDVAIRAAKAAGEILRDGLNSDTIAYDTKVNRNDPVTEFDLRADRAIVDIVRDNFPYDGILTEERGKDGISENRKWVIDPLDGTNNFSRHIPHFCVSIAYCDGNLPLVACIYDPIRNEIFTAIRGSGTQLNDLALRVSDQQSLEGSFLSVGSSKHTALREATHKQMPPFFQAARAIRTTGSAALDLAYVAAGRFDASWYPELSWWDVAAGILLI